jgi:hypothetical protein
MSLADKLLVIRPLTTKKQREDLIAACATDPVNHPQLFPSHICYMGGEIIGSLSVCVSPLSGIWSHSQKANVRDTLQMVTVARNLTRSLTSSGPALTMCAETSPIYPFMERMDFIKLGPTVLFLLKEGE